MGWNQGRTIMEATVVGAYDLGKLDKALLSVLLEPYRDTDIDSGGRVGLVAKDGKEVEQIVIEAGGLKMPEPPSVTQPDWANWDEWTSAEREASDAWEDHAEQVYEQFKRVTREHGW